MQSAAVTGHEVLAKLKELEPGKWAEVLDFIGYLKHRAATPKKVRPHSRDLTARDLLDFELVGLWAGRSDIGDSSAFASQLRHGAAVRPHER
jgi:hypothetical protein